MNNLFFLFFQKFDSNPEAMFDPTSDELRSRRKKGANLSQGAKQS